mgnify:CR=1 FL=1
MDVWLLLLVSISVTSPPSPPVVSILPMHFDQYECREQAQRFITMPIDPKYPVRCIGNCARMDQLQEELREAH